MDPQNDITVFERRKEGITHGWGVTLEEPFMERLAELDAESARAIASRAIRWRDQVVNFRGCRDTNSSNGYAYSVGRQPFVEILANRARELGVTISYERGVGDRSDLPEADLVVAADGVNSQLRSTADFGTTLTEGRNKYLWLGTGKVFDEFHFFFEETTAGWIWAYAHQHEPVTSTFIVECTPETWSGLGFDGCPPARTLDRLESIFAAPLAGRRLWTRFGDDAEAQWLRFRTVRNERWHSGNLVLVGDAAHTSHFSVGLGTTLAMQDSIALADHLRLVGQTPDDARQAVRIEDALEAYQQERARGLAYHATEAQRSAEWFENVARYTELSPPQFATVLHSRRAPLLPKLPPRLFCRLQAVRSRVGGLDRVRALLPR